MLTILLLTFAAAGGQAGTSAAPSPPAAEQVPAPAGYSYDAGGRRDPFLSLVGRGDDPTQGGTQMGLPGLLVNEVLVKGVIRGRSGYIAMLQGSDTRTYIVRPGDRLFDGTVKTISQDGVTFSQEVKDPLSLLKGREISKRVRAADVVGSPTGQSKEPK
jgi:hypothetical protein